MPSRSWTSLAVVLAAGCGGGSDDAPDVGALTVTINAPRGATPSVSISGPDGFTAALAETTTLDELAPGTYTVTAEPLLETGTVVSVVDDVSVSGGPATVIAGETATVDVEFTPRPGTGHLWYADSSNTTVSSLPASALEATGMPTPDVGLGFNNTSSPSWPAFARDGSLWLMDSGNEVVNRFAPALLGTTSAPTPTATISVAPDFPRATLFDAMGNLWVGSDNGVRKYAAADLAGDGMLSISPAVTVKPSAVGFYLNSLAIDADGNLWIAYQSGGAPAVGKIYKLTPDQLTASGTPTPAKVLTSPDLLSPSAIAFDPHGNLWAADFATTKPSNLVRFDAASLAGTGTTTSSGMSIVSNALDEPNDIAFDASGNLWVTNAAGGTTTIPRFSASQLVGSGMATLTPSVIIMTSAGGLAGLAFDPAP